MYIITSVKVICFGVKLPDLQDKGILDIGSIAGVDPCHQEGRLVLKERC
jgi:hypothetical protein